MELRTVYAGIDSYNVVMQHVLEADDAQDAIAFLRLWNEGEFDKCRKHWPEVPEQAYVGVDSQMPEYKFNAKLDSTVTKAFVDLTRMFPDILTRYSKNDPKRKRLARIQKELLGEVA